jgi:hypothetical protein
MSFVSHLALFPTLLSLKKVKFKKLIRPRRVRIVAATERRASAPKLSVNLTRDERNSGLAKNKQWVFSNNLFLQILEQKLNVTHILLLLL